jgi:hypothetical protein
MFQNTALSGTAAIAVGLPKSCQSAFHPKSDIAGIEWAQQRSSRLKATHLRVFRPHGG